MSETESLGSGEERDEILLLNINKWLNDGILPPELQYLTNWDVYETLHDDRVSIVEVGSTVYKNKCKATIESFLEESDEDEDDDLKQHKPKSLQLEISKIEMLRIVFDLNTKQTPKVLAIYHKQKRKYQQIFKVKQFDDNEIHSICMDSEHELNEMEQCDLSLLFKSLSKKQLMHGIRSFINKANNKYLTHKIKDLRNLNELMMRDKEFIMIIVAQVVGMDDGIIDEFNAFIDSDLDHLMNHQFKQNMMDLRNETNESNFEMVLSDIESICKKAKSLNQLNQKEMALNTVTQVVQQFLMDWLAVMDMDDLDEAAIDIEHHSKLKYRISDLETVMENISNGMNVIEYRQKLSDVKQRLMKWQKQLLNTLPVFGPLFSDNIRSLNKKLNAKKRQRSHNDIDDGTKSMKKRKTC